MIGKKLEINEYRKAIHRLGARPHACQEERLKPDWIKRWLLDPQSIQSGTKMPKFFREEEFQDYISGTPEEQTEAMKDYLMNLDAEKLVNEVKK